MAAGREIEAESSGGVLQRQCGAEIRRRFGWAENDEGTLRCFKPQSIEVQGGHEFIVPPKPWGTLSLRTPLALVLERDPHFRPINDLLLIEFHIKFYHLGHPQVS